MSGAHSAKRPYKRVIYRLEPILSSSSFFRLKVNVDGYYIFSTEDFLQQFLEFL